jgi:hypothetical protein
VAKKLWLRTFCADIEKGCDDVPDESCDVAFFSPPYKEDDGYTDELMRALGRLLARVMAPGGRVWMNFGQLREQLDRPQCAARLLELGASSMLRPGQTVIWAKSIAVPSWRETLIAYLKQTGTPSTAAGVGKLLGTIKKILRGPGRPTQRGHYQPINSPYLMHYCWEYVFQFHKLPEPKLDRLSVGVPFTHKSNLTRGTRGKNGDLHCPGDIWFIPYQTTGRDKKKTHRYEFPEKLVEHALRVSGIHPGGTVIDPFLGSGTTVRVAKQLGLNAYGIDKSKRALTTTRRRWANA